MAPSPLSKSFWSCGPCEKGRILLKEELDTIGFTFIQGITWSDRSSGYISAPIPPLA
uniref:Uncharacterized protein n=1 Tax=Lepeophtheirus salmonis TaxID=72036 RepID=A0A0K2T3J4_LEPSM